MPISMHRHKRLKRSPQLRGSGSEGVTVRTPVELVNAFDYYACPFCIDFHVYSIFTVVFLWKLFFSQLVCFFLISRPRDEKTPHCSQKLHKVLLRLVSHTSQIPQCMLICKAESHSVIPLFIFPTLYSNHFSGLSLSNTFNKFCIFVCFLPFSVTLAGYRLIVQEHG